MITGGNTGLGRESALRLARALVVGALEAPALAHSVPATWSAIGNRGGLGSLWQRRWQWRRALAVAVGRAGRTSRESVIGASSGFPKPPCKPPLIESIEAPRLWPVKTLLTPSEPPQRGLQPIRAALTCKQDLGVGSKSITGK